MPGWMSWSRRHRNKGTSIFRIPRAQGETDFVAKTSPQQAVPHENISTLAFSVHMSKYLGKTVTVFIKGGGVSGMGYTGVLSSVCGSCISLVIKPGPAPACSLGNACAYRYPIFGVTGAFPSQLGAVVTILADKITAFVHDAAS